MIGHHPLCHSLMEPFTSLGYDSVYHTDRQMWFVFAKTEEPEYARICQNLQTFKGLFDVLKVIMAEF